jgi:osmotically-inducible protein OsmY
MTTILLSGCMSAVSGGTNLVYNRYSVDQSVGNTVNAAKAQHLIDSNPAFSHSSVTVDTQGSDALLTGEIDNSALKQKAETILNTELSPKPKRIYNYLTVGPVVSTSTHLNDDWITTKIRSDIVADGSIDPHAVKVVTENSVVYIMGTIQQDQAKKLLKIARTTDGVKRVVSLMHYLVPAGN